QVRFIAAACFAHVHHLDNRIDVWIKYITLRVGGGMGGLVFLAEVRHVIAAFSDLDCLGADFFIEYILEDDNLAAVGLAAGRLGGGVGIGEIFGNDTQAIALRLHAGGGDFHRIG